MPLVLILGLLGLGLVALREAMDQSGYARVETAEMQVEGTPVWADPRWELELGDALAGLAPFDPDEAEPQRELLAVLGDLSFVAQVGEARVVWPDGVEVELELRRPLACVRIDNGYLAVDETGTVLAGEWTAPPFARSAFLPVIGPNDGSFDGWRPGMELVEQRHLDGLSIALSMWSDLEAVARRGLGRCLIDATRARQAGPREPGALLLLEGGREIHWGRSPNQDEPGELPVAIKWGHVERGLEILRGEETDDDWVVLDARWDEPVLKAERDEDDGAAGSR